MLCENPVLDSKNVRRDPIDRPADAGESAVHDDEISVGHNDARLVPECRRQPFDEIEESLAPRLDVSTVLDVARRPIPLGLGVIPPVEQRFERLEDELLVSRFFDVRHIYFFRYDAIRNKR